MCLMVQRGDFSSLDALLQVGRITYDELHEVTCMAVVFALNLAYISACVERHVATCKHFVEVARPVIKRDISLWCVK